MTPRAHSTGKICEVLDLPSSLISTLRCRPALYPRWPPQQRFDLCPSRAPEDVHARSAQASAQSLQMKDISFPSPIKIMFRPFDVRQNSSCCGLVEPITSSTTTSFAALPPRMCRRGHPRPCFLDPRQHRANAIHSRRRSSPINRASVVFPHPGGPHNIIEADIVSSRSSVRRLFQAQQRLPVRKDHPAFLDASSPPALSTAHPAISARVSRKDSSRQHTPSASKPYSSITKFNPRRAFQPQISPLRFPHCDSNICLCESRSLGMTSRKSCAA